MRVMWKEVLAWLGIASLVMFLAGVVVVPVLVARMPADHFVRPRPKVYRHPVLHAILVIARNSLGVLLLAAGIAMLVLPGQGILTILIALGLMDFPGKRRFELAIVSRKPVLKTINWLRARAHQAPLQLGTRGSRG
jgi:hypothetical protein